MTRPVSSEATDNELLVEDRRIQVSDDIHTCSKERRVDDAILLELTNRGPRIYARVRLDEVVALEDELHPDSAGPGGENRVGD